MDEAFEVVLTDMAYGGDAVGRAPDGRAVFVPFGLPGETVRVQAEHSQKKWMRGRLVDVLQPSPVRTAPSCRHFAQCGGCHYQHVEYAAQVHIKQEILRQQLIRLGGIPDPPMLAPIPSPRPFALRKHMRFHLTPAGEIGLIARDGRTIFPIEECLLPESALQILWKQLDLRSASGTVQAVSLRLAGDDQPFILFEALDAPQAPIDIDMPGSIAWQDRQGILTLAGDPWLAMQVEELTFRVSPGAFFQVNSALLPVMVEHVIQALQPGLGAEIFDLYAGVGLFSAFLARAGASIQAVEISPAAGDDYAANLQAFDRIELFQAPVELALPALRRNPAGAVADPPRAGLGNKVVEALAAAAPDRLVYISCDPATLGRDARLLRSAGYRLAGVTLIDMFPQTYHIESISLWLPV
jgi:23S rRNA (uracil1939-C5)-methyltransferase